MTKGVSRYIIPQNATCHSERSEESRVHQVGVTEILRFALDDKMKGNFYFDIVSNLDYSIIAFSNILAMRW